MSFSSSSDSEDDSFFGTTFFFPFSIDFFRIGSTEVLITFFPLSLDNDSSSSMDCFLPFLASTATLPILLLVGGV